MNNQTNLRELQKEIFNEIFETPLVLVGRDFFVFLVLIAHMNSRFIVKEFRLEDIKQIIGLTRQTLRKSINSLEKLNYLVKTRRANGIYTYDLSSGVKKILANSLNSE